MQLKSIKEKNQKILFVTGLMAILIFLIWKSQYGLGGKDIPFYITIPYRVINGDVLFWDEWNMAQLSSILFIPITKVFYLVVGSTESIMIWSRLLYIVTNLIMATLLYWKIKNFGKYAILISWIYALYSPFNHNMLSYNSIGVMVAILGIVILAMARNKRDYVYVGLCYSLATICQPLLVVVFIVAVAALIVFGLIKRKRDIIKKTIITSTICIICAVPSVLYFIFLTRVDRFMKVWPYMQENLRIESNFSTVWDNPIRLIFGSFLTKAKYDFCGISFNTVYLSLAVYLSLIILVGIYFLSILLKKKNCQLNRFLIIIACILATIQSIIYCFSFKVNPINYIWIPWIFVGILLFDGQKDKIIKRIYLLSIVWGVAHTIGYATSNGGGAVFAVAWFPTALFSILLLKDNSYMKLVDHKRIITVCLIICFSAFCFIRGASMFYDTDITKMNYRIMEGPAKGIKVNKKDYEFYNMVKNDLKKLKTKNKSIVLITERVWTYLFVDSRLSQHSAYISEINKRSIKIIYDYRKSKNEKIPDIIYIPKDELNDISLKSILDILKIKKYSINDSDKSYIVFTK